MSVVVERLIQECSRRGIQLSVIGERLRYKASSAEVLTPDFIEQLKTHKPQLLRALSSKVYCAGCRNLRMSEVMIPGEGRRFVWGCSKGHMEHGHSTPELRRLTEPEVCLQARDYAPIRERERV